MFSIVFSAHVSEDTSLLVAENAFEKLHSSKNGGNFIIKNIKTIDHEDIPLFYIYNLEPKGFIIVSAESNALPILGYGFESNFKLDNTNLSLAFLEKLSSSSCSHNTLSSFAGRSGYLLISLKYLSKLLFISNN